MRVSDLMQAMSDAGAPMEAILIAVHALEERDEIIAQKRTVERERKRRQRERNKEADGTVTGQSREADGTVTDMSPLSLPLSSPQTPQLTPTHTPPDNNTRARKGACAKPDDVSQDIWDDFLGLRRVRRAPVTENVVASIRKEAGKARLTLEAALTECVARGWQSFRADWGPGSKPQAPPGNDYLASLPSRTPVHAK